MASDNRLKSLEVGRSEFVGAAKVLPSGSCELASLLGAFVLRANENQERALLALLELLFMKNCGKFSPLLEPLLEQ